MREKIMNQINNASCSRISCICKNYSIPELIATINKYLAESDIEKFKKFKGCIFSAINKEASVQKIKHTVCSSVINHEIIIFFLELPTELSFLSLPQKQELLEFIDSEISCYVEISFKDEYEQILNTQKTKLLVSPDKAKKRNSKNGNPHTNGAVIPKFDITIIEEQVATSEFASQN